MKRFVALVHVYKGKYKNRNQPACLRRRVDTTPIPAPSQERQLVIASKQSLALAGLASSMPVFLIAWMENRCCYQLKRREVVSLVDARSNAFGKIEDPISPPITLTRGGSLRFSVTIGSYIREERKLAERRG